jgi:hypothetical protein
MRRRAANGELWRLDAGVCDPTGNSAAFGGYLLNVSSCNSTPPSVPGWGAHWTIWQYEIPECGRAGAGSATVAQSGAVVFNGVIYEFARGADGTWKYWFGAGGGWSPQQVGTGSPTQTFGNGL